MKQYEVYLVKYASIVVEANSEDEAHEIVADMSLADPVKFNSISPDKDDWYIDYVEELRED